MGEEKALKVEKESFIGRLKNRMIARRVNSLIKNEQKLYKYYKSRSLKDRGRVTRSLESLICEDSRYITQIKGMEIASENGGTIYESNPFNINVLEVARNLNYSIDSSESSYRTWQQVTEGKPGCVEYASILGSMLSKDRVAELFGVFLDKDVANSATYKEILKKQNGRLLTDENIASLIQNGEKAFDANDLINNPNLLKYNSQIYIHDLQELPKEFIFMHPEILQNRGWKENNEFEITLDDISKNRFLLENPIYRKYFSLQSITEVEKIAPELLEDKEISEKLMQDYFKNFLAFVNEIPEDNAEVLQYTQKALLKFFEAHSNTYQNDVYKFPVKALMPLISTMEQCKGQYSEDMTIDNSPNSPWYKCFTMAKRMNEIEAQVDPDFARRIEKLYYAPNLILGAHGTAAKDISSFFEKGLKNNSQQGPNITYTVALQKGVTTNNESELYEMINYTAHATKNESGSVIYTAIPRDAILPNSNQEVVPIWRQEKGEEGSYLLPQYIVGALTDVTLSIENNGEFIENPQFNPIHQIEELNQDPNIKYLPDVSASEITKENNER